MKRLRPKQTCSATSGPGFFFFVLVFFLASSLVGTVLLGSFQACAGHTPAPDILGDGARSKPLLVTCGLEHRWPVVGRSGLTQHLTGERLVHWVRPKPCPMPS